VFVSSLVFPSFPVVCVHKCGFWLISIRPSTSMEFRYNWSKVAVFTLIPSQGSDFPVSVKSGQSSKLTKMSVRTDLTHTHTNTYTRAHKPTYTHTHTYTHMHQHTIGARAKGLWGCSPSLQSYHFSSGKNPVSFGPKWPKNLNMDQENYNQYFIIEYDIIISFPKIFNHQFSFRILHNILGRDMTILE
jgi:hypothetical protein